MGPYCLLKVTIMRNRWDAIANPHAIILNPQHPQIEPLGHDPGHRLKILFDMFYIYICENTHTVGLKIFVIEV